jgi:ADP-L-glycero-D-manno-heptose 6-epimerase
VDGIFNVGTGRARTYLDLAHAVCDACGVARAAHFVDMPEALRPQYQNFTEARIERLRAAGYAAPFQSLEDGIAGYVRNFLSQPDPYR